MAAAESRGQDREYETIYVLRPDVERERIEEISTRLTEAVGREGGKLTRLESWGRRRLAYPVQKHKRGIYIYLKYIGRGGAVSELERNLRLLDTVLKYQTVKLADLVGAEAYEIRSEDVKLEHVEGPPEVEEVEESRARELGLEGSPLEIPSSRGDLDDMDEDDFGDAEDEESREGGDE